LRAPDRPVSLMTGYLGINRAHTPLDNLLVRQAIAHAINKQHLINIYFGSRYDIGKELLPPSLWGYDPSIMDYDYDPALSRSLLALAGYPNGFATTLAYRPVIRPYLPDPANTAAAISADLQAVGITATVIEYESSLFLSKVYN
jgi:peptide/nickel transport system substrate-binding protein